MKTQPGAASAPLHMVAYWKCESCQTDVRLDYKFNAHAQASPAALRNLMISIPIEGAVTSMQAKPQGEWQVVSPARAPNFAFNFRFFLFIALPPG